MYKIERIRTSTYNIVDKVYKDSSLLFEQNNFNNKNKFGNSTFKCDNGKTLTVKEWVKNY